MSDDNTFTTRERHRGKLIMSHKNIANQLPYNIIGGLQSSIPIQKGDCQIKKANFVQFCTPAPVDDRCSRHSMLHMNIVSIFFLSRCCRQWFAAVMHDSEIGIHSGISHISAGIRINKIKLGWNRNRNQKFIKCWNWNQNQNQDVPRIVNHWFAVDTWKHVMYMKLLCKNTRQSAAAPWSMLNTLIIIVTVPASVDGVIVLRILFRKGSFAKPRITDSPSACVLTGIELWI